MTQQFASFKSARLALVTGASSGIGQAVALRLAHDGFHILANYNENKVGAQQTLTQIQSQGGSGDLIQFDVKNSESIQKNLDFYFSNASSETPTFYALVNNAGIHRDGLLGLMSDGDLDEVMKTNVYGPFFLMRYSMRKMLKARQGVIINMASLAGQTGNAGQINYAASKGALIAMTKSLSMEVGSRGIRVNAVAPGLIETQMISQIPNLEDLKKRIPLGRIGTAADVAGAVSFLCSDDASYITGHTLSVNGGLFPS